MIEIFRAFLASMLLLFVFSPAFPQDQQPKNSQPSSKGNDQPNTIASGKIQISTPSGWKTADDLNELADLQAVDIKNQMYLIVLTENKVDFSDMTLDKHSNLTLDELTKALTSVTKSASTKLRINGRPALQYEVRGTVLGLNIVYLHTTVETSAHFHQIVTWTKVSMYELKKDVFQNIIRSFKEI